MLESITHFYTSLDNKNADPNETKEWGYLIAEASKIRG